MPVTAGVGLRGKHFADFASGKPDAGFLEIHPENYFGGGARLHYLQEAAKHYALSFHCVGMSLGSVERPKADHLANLKRLVARFKPKHVSDHLSWSASGNAHLNDLLPLPYTEESFRFIAANIDHVQQELGCPISIENPSSYLAFRHSEIPEAEFMNQLAAKTGCGILLDLNNVFVSACNTNSSVQAHIDEINPAFVREYHLAGHSVSEDVRIDTHDAPVCNDVWDIYSYALRKIGARPTLIEWDAQLPELPVLLHEARKASQRLSWAMTPSYLFSQGIIHAAA